LSNHSGRDVSFLYRLRVPALGLGVAVLMAVSSNSFSSVSPAQAETTPPSASRVTAKVRDFTSAPGSFDIAVDGESASDGYHVRAARAASGFAWTDIAVIRPANMDEQTWFGYQCATDDGKYVAVAILPGDAINDNASRDAGAYAYAVNVATGAVTALASGVALMYHTPGCGIDDSAVFTAALGTNEQQTQVLRFDLASGKELDQSVVSGQVTSVVPTANGIVGAKGNTLVTVPNGGSTAKPASTKVLLAAKGPAYDLRPNNSGGTDFLVPSSDEKTTSVWHESSGHATDLGSGPITSVGLFAGHDGKNSVVDASTTGTSITSLGVSALPLGAQLVSLAGDAEFGASKSSKPAGAGPATAADAQSLGSDVPLVESVSSRKVFTAANSQVKVSPDRVTGKQVTGQGANAAKPSQPGLKESKAATSAFVKTGPSSLAVETAIDVESSAKTAVPALSPGATTPKCAVPRLTPTLQAMQPSNAQVDWATQMDEQGLLTLGAYPRPADFANMGLVSYGPSSDFPPVALDHPSGSTTTKVPRSVMLAIEAQESNFNQASWHALPGIAADPLIADYYGAGDSISTIDYPDADCGYGVAQVTDGMAAGDTSLSTHGQEKVAVDYEENIAAGMQILEQTWNELYGEGITVNGGDPKYLENWYDAAWAYNSGIQPDAAFGNTTGCIPSATCHGPDGTWGLGWSNNPGNPDYDPTRLPYLEYTYADAAHPSSWPYQERIMGWMGTAIDRYGYTGYNPPTYNGGETYIQVPPHDAYCTSSNDCTTTTGTCTLSDSECWWHLPVTWVSSCSTTCATASYEDSSGSTLPTYTAEYSPTCTVDSSQIPGNALIVSDMPSPRADDDEGCPNSSWSNSGAFSYTAGQNSSGDPIGDIDTHQLGSGFGGRILFSHMEPAADTSLINTGTWTPTLPSLQYYQIKIHLPGSGAKATHVVYTVHPGNGGAVTEINVNQDWGSEEWVPIGTVAMENGGYVTLTNAGSGPAGSVDVAYDAIAFIPKGGTPGVPIGGAPTIEDEPAGSNPAAVNCGCATADVGDPVDVGTGYFSQSATDLRTPGLGEALNLNRTYTSSLADPSGPEGAAGQVNGAFGPGWTFSYGMSAFTATSGAVTITQEDGSQVQFTNSSGTYRPTLPRYDATLTASGGDYYYTRQGTDQFVFNSTSGQLVSKSDEAGRAASPQYATTLAYNGSGELSTVTDPGGRVYTFTWTGTHITSVTDTGGQEVDYAYNSSGQLTDVYGVGTTRTGGTNGNQDHAEYVYNSSDLMTSMRTPANYGKTGTPTPVTSMVYDSSDRVTSQSDPDGNTTALVYGPNTGDSLNAGQTLVTNGAGNKTLYIYTNGLLTSKTEGYGATGASTWSYSYDPVSLGVSEQTNPDGTTESFSYDAQGHRVSSTDGLGRTTSMQYNAAGQLTEETDPTGTQTTTTYNVAGAPTAVLVSESDQSTGSSDNVLDPTYARQSTYAYADAAHPTEVTTATDPNGKTTTYTYDSYGDKTSETDAASHVTKYGYNTSLGELTSTVSPTGTAAGTTTSCSPPATGCTTYAHDAFGNLATTTDPLEHTTNATFDADGNQLTSTDANSHTTTTAYDADDQPISVKQPSTATATTTYNGDSTVEKTTDANGKVTGYAYDAQGRKTSSTNPDSKVTNYTYDSMGRVKTVTQPDGEVMTNTWDGAGELTGIAYSGDASTPSIAYTYDGDGRRKSMTDGTGTTTYAYDVFGETASVTTGAGNTTAYTYDADGNTTSIAYPGANNTVTNNYNTIDQLSSVVDPAAQTTSFGYNADGAPTTTTSANGTVATVAYNAADQPTSSALTDGATALGTITYARNADGDLTGTTPASGVPGSTTTYSYNSNEQLTRATVGSTTTGYAYDSVGNPTTVGNATQTFDASGELCWSTTATVTSPTCGTAPSGATAYSFNGDGQRTASTPATGSATSLAYNSADELSTVSGAVSASYTYNGDGLRASKTVGGTTTTFTYDTNGHVPLLLADGTSDYVYGPTGAPVEQFTPGGSGPQYYFSDAHGSTEELTSGTGTLDATYAYNAWGKTTTHTGTAATAIEYAAAYVDAETGLLYFQDRYYDPTTAEFVTVDPLVADTLDPYMYAADNPLNLLDPLGLFTWSVGLIAGGISAITGVVGLALDGTVVGTVIGGPLEVISLAAGGVAIAADCGNAFGKGGGHVACALDIAGEASAGVGSIADVVNGVGKGAEAADAAAKATDVSSAFGNSEKVANADGRAAGLQSEVLGYGGSETLGRIGKVGGTGGLLAGSAAEGLSLQDAVCND
jgi:RHS repeat-associated protein